MTPEEIIEIANHPSTQKFDFGSPELDAWTKKHYCLHTGRCIAYSDWYVVHHSSWNPTQTRPFKVLSRWLMSSCVPISHDIPQVEDAHALALSS